MGGDIIFGYIVEIFFILSGFLTCSHTHNINNNRSFIIEIIKRWFRILPYAFLATLSCCIVYFVYCRLLKTVFIFDKFFSFANQIASLLLIHQGWVYEFALGINNPTWFLCVLIWIDIVFLGIVKLAENVKNEKTRDLLICTISMFFIILGKIGIEYKIALPFLYYTDFRGYSAFFMGVLIGVINLAWKNKSMKIITSLLLLFIGFVKIYLQGRMFQDNSFLFFIGPGIVILLASIKQYKSKYSSLLGGASFEVYLWHLPVYYLLKLICDTNGITVHHTYPIMLVILACIEIYGIFVYCKIEQPMSVFINQKILRIGSRS